MFGDEPFIVINNVINSENISNDEEKRKAKHDELGYLIDCLEVPESFPFIKSEIQHFYFKRNT